MVYADIITIGDELLIGQVIDTNSAWLAAQLSEMGFIVREITSCKDDANQIKYALNEASNFSQLIIITGGLGPTKDDITKNTLCNYFNSKLELHVPTLNKIEKIFSKRNLPMLESNRMQAMIPNACNVVENNVGTAPGMWFEKNEIIYISLPGVPSEMKYIFENEIKQKLVSRINLPTIIHNTILTAGIGESFLAEKILSIENALPSHIRLAYLPGSAQVRLRLTGIGSRRKQLEAEIKNWSDKIKIKLGNYFFGEENETLASVVGKLLLRNNKTVGIAESCTGGYTSHLITSIAGSSSYFSGSIIAYSNKIKEEILGVSKEIIDNYGAVSEACVIEMSKGVKALLKTDFGVSVSGIAGPSGGSIEKPVGTVWISVSGPERTIAQKYNLGNNRIDIIERAGILAIDLLRKEIH